MHLPWRPRKPMTLLVMRLDRMFATRPDQVNSHVCSSCGMPVGVYPSGQRILQKYPNTVIVCDVCNAARGRDRGPGPGALEEAREARERRRG